MSMKTVSALALAALLMTACQNDEETVQTDDRVALQVTSGIQTRELCPCLGSHLPACQ